MLQSKAGYIDARPLTASSAKPLATRGRTIHSGQPRRFDQGPATSGFPGVNRTLPMLCISAVAPWLRPKRSTTNPNFAPGRALYLGTLLEIVTRLLLYLSFGRARAPPQGKSGGPITQTTSPRHSLAICRMVLVFCLCAREHRKPKARHRCGRNRITMFSQSHRGLMGARPNWYFPERKDQGFD